MNHGLIHGVGWGLSEFTARLLIQVVVGCEGWWQSILVLVPGVHAVRTRFLNGVAVVLGGGGLRRSTALLLVLELAVAGSRRATAPFTRPHRNPADPSVVSCPDVELLRVLELLVAELTPRPWAGHSWPTVGRCTAIPLSCEGKS